MKSEQINVSISIHDPEFSGQVRDALGSGRDFAFYLAQLNQDPSERTRFQRRPERKTISSDTENYYRRPPLSANDNDLQCLAIKSTYLHHQSRATMQLWACMFPEPLTQYNDPHRIEPEVIENCDYATQQKLMHQPSYQHETIPAMLETLIPAERALLSA